MLRNLAHVYHHQANNYCKQFILKFKAHQTNNMIAQLLPSEVQSECFSFLDAESLVAAECVCREFNESAKKQFLWRSLCERDWTNNVHSAATSDNYQPIMNDDIEINETGDWKQLYKQRYVKYKKWERSLYVMYSDDREFIHKKKRLDRSDDTIDLHSARNTIDGLRNEIRFIIAFPILYLKLLWFFFVAAYKQPQYIRISEAEFIKRRALTAGTWLLNTLCFVPIIIMCLMLNTHVIIDGSVLLYFIIAYAVSGVYGHFDRPIDITNTMDRVLCWFSCFTAIMTLLLSLKTDDLIVSSIIVFQLSIALGLANSLRVMIGNETETHQMYTTPPVATGNKMYELMHGKPVVTNMIWLNLLAIVLALGGPKLIALIIIVLAFILSGGGSWKLISDFLTFRIVVVLLAAIFSTSIYILSLKSIGGNYHVRSKSLKHTSRILLALLILSYIALLTRVLRLVFNDARNWEITGLDEYLIDMLKELAKKPATTDDK
jgi:hypothetical protein